MQGKEALEEPSLWHIYEKGIIWKASPRKKRQQHSQELSIKKVNNDYYKEVTVKGVGDDASIVLQSST